jgi:NADPH:quinone reductase-like Zn-dependent oxidoreductase
VERDLLTRVLRLHPEGFRLGEKDRPVPGEGEVLVRVHAAAITRGELDWPANRLPAVPSYEVSGVVAETGEEVFGLTPFDRDGVAAEYAAVPEGVLAAKPTRLTHVEAAALPGERVVVTGASGGVGHLAVQLARQAGAEVEEEGPADVVFDTIGGELPAGGRVVTIAAEAPGATYFIVEPDRGQLVELARLADAGELPPAIDSTFSLERAQEAFDRVAQRGKRGKVVLDVAGG